MSTGTSAGIAQRFYENLSLKYPYVLDGNWEKLKAISLTRKLDKGDILVRDGGILNYGVFVITGWVKFSYTDEEGRERISAFCRDGDYVDNWNNLHKQTPLNYSIVAMGPATVLLYPIRKMVEIFKNEPDLLQLCVDLSQEMLFKKEEHYNVLLLKTPLERYQYLRKHHASWLQEISLTDLARYLHISREALSRARSEHFRS